jgi:transcriptional regulator with XRE-family HTH domain
MPVVCRTISLVIKEANVKRLKLDGRRVKQLRENLDRGSTQKEFSHHARISERKLRSIENSGAPVAIDVAERIAHALGRPMHEFIAREDEPASPVPANGTAIQGPTPTPSTRIIPRFDTAYARVVRDEAELFTAAKGNRTVISHIVTRLTAETSAYAEEMLTMLRSLSWDARGTTEPIDGLEELGLRRRLRELLVLLKGNDVWVYVDEHMKLVPESFEVQPKSSPREWQPQTIIAFGQPGEYGEETIKVPIDNGQPWMCEYPQRRPATDLGIFGKMG